MEGEKPTGTEQRFIIRLVLMVAYECDFLLSNSKNSEKRCVNLSPESDPVPLGPMIYHDCQYASQ